MFQSRGKNDNMNSFLVSSDFCQLLITFVNSLDPNQDQQNIGPDMDQNCLTCWKFTTISPPPPPPHTHTHTKGYTSILCAYKVDYGIYDWVNSSAIFQSRRKNDNMNSFLVSSDFCQLLITFVNSLDPDQDQQKIGSDRT